MEINEIITKNREVCANDVKNEMLEAGFVELPFGEVLSILEKYLNEDKTFIEIKNEALGKTTQIPVDAILGMMSNPKLIDVTNGKTVGLRQVVYINPNYNFDFLYEGGSIRDEYPVLSIVVEHIQTNSPDKNLTPTELSELKKHPSYQTYLKLQGSQPGDN